MHTAYKLSALSSAVIAALTFASPLMAAEGDAQEEKQGVEQVADQAGEEVVVRDTRAEALTSFQQLNRQDIANRPQGNGNITDLLRSNPNVQFSNSSANSLQMGNLRPADISIHGNLAYQTNYSIDGISANSDLDPARNINGVNVVHLDSSDEQGFYVDTSLIESVTVYDNNVPVEFGGFTGGVVDTQTRRWSGENHFNVFVRGTRSGWSEEVVDPDLHVNSGDASMARPGQFQTDFDKTTYGFTGEFGISDNLGLVVGYTRRESKIPQIQVASKEIVDVSPTPPMYPGMPSGVNIQTKDHPETVSDHKQTADNLFVKGTLYISDATELDVSFNYSGFKSEGFLPTVTNSNYSDSHDGYNLMANLKHQFANALWTTTVGYSLFEDERDSDFDHWYDVKSYDPFDITNPNNYLAQTGGNGDLTSKQEVFTAKTKLEFEPIQYQNTSHQFTIGADMSVTKAEYERDKDHYRWSINEMDMFGQKTHMLQTTRFVAGKSDADFQQFGAFAQHTMEAGDWTFRTGVRGEYDDFTEDFNFAPRFTASWDVFSNNNTIATFGANRYYGRTILAYALYGAQNAGMQHAGVDAWSGEFVKPGETPIGGWRNANDFDGLNDLETPYDDELSLSLTQRLPAQLLSNITYVHRQGEKGVRSWQTGSYNNGDTIRHFDNSGKTDHDSVTFSITNTKPMNFIGADHTFRFSAAWSDTKSNMGLDTGYNDVEVSVNPNFDPSRVSYDGKIIKTEDLDATDYNIPLKFMLETTHNWNQYGMTWFNFFRWDGSRDQAMRPDSDAYATAPDGRQVARYEKVHFGSNWAWDTKLQYHPDWARGLELAVEVTNVLNNKNVVDSFVFSKGTLMSGTKTARYDIYEPGRQLWLQMSYNY